MLKLRSIAELRAFYGIIQNSYFADSLVRAVSPNHTRSSINIFGACSDSVKNRL
jgi:hypothetical protein